MRTPLLLALSTCPLIAIPVTTPLTLSEESGFNELALTINPPVLPADTATSTLTSVPGQPITATLDVDPSAGTTNEFSMTGGRIEGTDTTFSNGNILGSYTVNLTNVGGTVSTPNPPAPVDPATGNFDATLHQFTIDQGQAAGSISAIIVGTIPIDISFTPTESFTGSGSGEGTITLTETSANALTKSFDVEVTIPVDITEVTEADGQEVTIRAVGTIKLEGSAEVPISEYIAWTIENSIPGAPADDDNNGDGVRNGIAWALGYDGVTDASPSLPRPSDLIPGGFEILLPNGGTAAPLVAETSSTLGSWADIDTGRLSTVSNPIPAGSTGTVTIAPSGAPREFIRLSNSD